jgi:di/tricarboxylate transporter
MKAQKSKNRLAVIIAFVAALAWVIAAILDPWFRVIGIIGAVFFFLVGVLSWFKSSGSESQTTPEP